MKPHYWLGFAVLATLLAVGFLMGRGLHVENRPWVPDKPIPAPAEPAPEPTVAGFSAADLGGTRWETDGIEFSFETGGVVRINGEPQGTWSVYDSGDLGIMMGDTPQRAQIEGEELILGGARLTRKAE